jgi:hypothetical protein
MRYGDRRELLEDGAYPAERYYLYGFSDSGWDVDEQMFGITSSMPAGLGTAHSRVFRWGQIWGQLLLATSPVA